jgi:hypothetical protein
MFYYTHHSDMDVPQYVQVDVPYGYVCYWIFYYTHHSNMHAPQYIYLAAYVFHYNQPVIIEKKEPYYYLKNW